MTNTHSRRRTVVTVAFLAAAFLSLNGCGGGSDSSTGPIPPPPSESYVSAAYGERQTANGSRWRWSIAFGPSSAAAQTDAQRLCAGELGATCAWSVRGTTGCVAVALSTCGTGCSTPALGLGAGPTRAEAQNRALALCRSSVTVSGSVCSIPTGSAGLAIGCGSG